MKIEHKLILFLFVITTFACDNDDDEFKQSNINQEQNILDFGDDIVIENHRDDNRLININKKNLLKIINSKNLDNNKITYYTESNIKELDFNKSNVFKITNPKDSDNDGITDYAESNIEELDPNKFNDLLSIEPGTILTISTINGIKEVPLYQTSFYQKKMFQLKISFSNQYSWTETQKKKVREIFFKVKKVWLTPEFQKFTIDKVGNLKAKTFFSKFRTVKRDIQFRYSKTAGNSNQWSFIGIAPWVLSSDHLSSTISHELVHHMGFGHNGGIPYGTQRKAKSMIKRGKADYPIFDINKKTNYVKPCIPYSISRNNGYQAIHFIEIPGTGINLKNNWSPEYKELSTPVTFNRGYNYKSITRTINSGKYSIWIDFNDDAVFDNSEQLLNNVRIPKRKKKVYNFSIPENANRGVHRLRIVKSFVNSAKACRYYRGQAIDFTNVTIK